MITQWKVTYLYGSELKYIIIESSLWNIASEASSRGVYDGSILSVEKVAIPA